MANLLGMRKWTEISFVCVFIFAFGIYQELVHRHDAYLDYGYSHFPVDSHEKTIGHLLQQSLQSDRLLLFAGKDYISAFSLHST